MFGSFGDRLSALPQAPFFQWFSLEPYTDVGPLPDVAVRAFKPSGEAFHDCVTLEAVTNDDERIASMRLILSRSFVNDARHGAFALDVTKSFLQGALGQTPLGKAFEFRMGDAAMIKRAGATGQPPRISDVEEAALQTYDGQRPDCEIRSGDAFVRFSNEKRGPIDRVLVIEIRPPGSAAKRGTEPRCPTVAALRAGRGATKR